MNWKSNQQKIVSLHRNSFIMKYLFFIVLLFPVLASAQNKSLMVEGVSPNLFVSHKVAPKENYYSIGRIYNISPREIAPFNKLELESGLSLGQSLKIPLIVSNFFQSGIAESDEIFVPVFYTLKDKEGLFRVALNHNDLSLETLKKWNNIKGDAVSKGTKLIVGYLKVKKELSELAKGGTLTSINNAAVASVKTETKEIVVEKPVSKASVVTTTPIVKAVEKEKPAVVQVVKEPIKVEIKPAFVGTKNDVGGFFKSMFEAQIKNAELIEQEGVAGIFKSTSGWEDGKYYCLHNNASVGTIIKITNPENGKFVFAKVLDLMPEMVQNNDLIIRLSNAASAVLGIENNFNCTLIFSK